MSALMCGCHPATILQALSHRASRAMRAHSRRVHAQVELLGDLGAGLLEEVNPDHDLLQGFGQLLELLDATIADVLGE